MQLHYPDGTPFDPQDALDALDARMKAAKAFGFSAHAYGSADGAERVGNALIAIVQDFEETKAVIEEWFDRLLPESGELNVGGWGTDKPLRPRLGHQEES